MKKPNTGDLIIFAGVAVLFAAALRYRYLGVAYMKAYRELTSKG